MMIQNNGAKQIKATDASFNRTCSRASALQGENLPGPVGDFICLRGLCNAQIVRITIMDQFQFLFMDLGCRP